MTTSPDRQMYRTLVAQVAEKARAILPDQTNGRIESAVKLVLQGDVLPQADGSVQVGSSDPTRWYVLTGQACTCTDFVQERAPAGWCKHRISAGILKRVTELLPQEPDEPAAAAALPEAPASVNVRVVIGGREVQWTLRDSDEARLAARLEALLARYPVEGASPSVPPQPEATTRACPVHPGVLMTEQHNARGAWWSHKTADGWCKGTGGRP